MDQNTLLEYMQELCGIAKASDNQMTKEEIGSYLADMDLGSAQMEAVYQYLSAKGVKIPGYTYVVPAQELQAGTSQEDDGELQENPKYQLGSRQGRSQRKKPGRSAQAQRNWMKYQDEVAGVETLSGSMEQELFTRFLLGEEALRDRLIQGRLSYVQQVAKKYIRRPVPTEELVAEGNLALMTAFLKLQEEAQTYLLEEQVADMAGINDLLEKEIVTAMEYYIDDDTQQKDWEDAVVARTNLLHEAAKYLAEELGRVATPQELSDYTKIGLDEIVEITSLSEDAKRALKP